MGSVFSSHHPNSSESYQMESVKVLENDLSISFKTATPAQPLHIARGSREEKHNTNRNQEHKPESRTQTGISRSCQVSLLITILTDH
jgi:hypothetical protein